MPSQGAHNDFGYQGKNSLAGFVYTDYSVDGIFQPAGSKPETGIPGVTITLDWVDSVGRTFSRTTATGADGSYFFDGLPAGDFRITEAQPPSVYEAGSAGYYDGLDTPGLVNGVPSGSSPAKNQLAVSFPATEDPDGVGFNFGENPSADPFGFVYADLNANDRRDPGEPGIPGVPVTISGTAFAGTPLARPLTAAEVPGGLARTTDVNGRWEFAIMPPGVYTIAETQPAGYLDGAEEDADPAGPPATVGADRFDNVVLNPFPVRGPFNFGERVLPRPPIPLPPVDFFPQPPGVSKRAFLGSTVPRPPVPSFAAVPDFAAFGAPATRAVSFVAVAQDAGGGMVRVFDFTTGVERFRFRPFGDFAGGVRVATADVTGDGAPDVITAAGPGGGPRVSVYDGNTGTLITTFFAFEPSFAGGAFVAAGDMNGDGRAEVVVSADAGGGPRVAVFDGATFAMVASVFAYEPTFAGGVRVAVGDVNGDGRADLVVVPGAGGGPRVAGFDGAALATGAPNRLFADFFAIDPELRTGFWIAAGDVDRDGFADLIVGAGAGGGPRVVAYGGRSLAAGAGSAALGTFFAGDPGSRSGVRVAVRDLESDGGPELLAAAGGGTWPLVYVFDPLTGNRRDVFYAFPTTFPGGVFVG